MRGSSPRMTGGKSGSMLLSDVLIIDATDRLGWVAGRVLADLGADVVKLEPPGGDRGGADWRAFNVNKRILELDLQAPSDRARIEDLLRAADVCLLTPSDSAAHLDPHALRENYPRLVVVAIRPFGGVGPRSAWKASDIELMAAGGAMALAGERAAILRVGRRPSRDRRARCAVSSRRHRPRRSRRLLRPGVGRDRAVPRARFRRSRRPRAHARRRFHHRALDQGRALPRVLAVPRRLHQLHLLWRRGGAAHQRAARRVDARTWRRARRARRHRLEGLGPHQGRSGRGRRHRGAGGEILRSPEQARIPDRRAPARNAGLSGVDGRRYRQRSPARGARLLPDHRQRRRALCGQLRGDRRRAAAAASRSRRAVRRNEVGAGRARDGGAAAPGRGPVVTAVAQALAGLKVLEFGGYAAGPHIGKVLANFGASTIHMESRERPDGFRIQYPPFKDNRHGYNRSGCFAFFNDSKYSVTVDLKKPAGVALARRMAQWCDLIVENMRAGVMERLGLGFATLAELNPRLVMLSTCNMGQTGPRADQPGFGSQLSALAGMCELTGVPDGPPMLLYGPYIDYIASLLGSSAAIAGVIRSRRT